MSIPNEPGKVVDLQQRQAAQQFGGERLAELYKSARMQALKRLNQMAGEAFEKIDDALFDLAEKSETSAQQTRYFDGMREVRRKRPEMERRFQESFQAGFSDPQRLQADKDRERSGGAELSLVGETELEETLAIGSMVGKAENRLSRGLYALTQRLSVVMGGAKVADEDNPFGPRAVTRAFKDAISCLDAEIEVKLFILKLFDKYVMGGLDHLYEEVNQLLMDGGVLPQLKPQLAGLNRRPGPALPPGMPMPAESDNPELGPAMGEGPGLPMAGGPMLPPPGGPLPPMPGGMAMGAAGYPAQGGYAQQGDVGLQWELYNTLRALMSQRHPQAQQVHAGPTYGTNDLLSALSLLQTQNTGGPAGPGGLSFLGGPSINVVQQVKDDLISQVGKLSGGPESGQRVASADEDTIDLVGMLFEYILQDRNLPAEIQALLARLQIPYLKAAILDKHLFARKEHPARRLLDELAQAGVSWTEEGDKDRRLFEKIRQVVETLLRDFDDNVEIFERLLREFADFIAGSRKRSDIAEQRTTEAARGREKLQNARKTAAREVLRRMDGKRLPEVIRHILTRPWANVLVLTLLRQGEGTPQWNAALRVADELVWSALPKDNPNDKSRLRALGPELDKALRQGLSLVAYPDADVQQLLHELATFRTSMLDPGKVPAPVVIESLGDDDDANEFIIENKSASALQNLPSAREESFVEEIAGRREASTEVEEEEDGEQGPDDDYVAMARNVKVGVWVEFRDNSGGVERAKLSWISPISSKFLFVNRKGLKVADKTVWGLAAELRKGMAVILEDVPLFDRALDAIVERLKGGTPEPAGEVSSEAAGL